jgi:hypothetical protein
MFLLFPIIWLAGIKTACTRKEKEDAPSDLASSSTNSQTSLQHSVVIS